MRSDEIGPNRSRVSLLPGNNESFEFFMDEETAALKRASKAADVICISIYFVKDCSSEPQCFYGIFGGTKS